MEPILLHIKDDERSTLLIDKQMYEKNKADYDKVNYVIARPEIVKAYFAKRGINLTQEQKENQAPKKLEDRIEEIKVKKTAKKPVAAKDK